jgi:hypothetical protein
MLFRKLRWIIVFVQFFIVVKLLSMIVAIFIGVPVAAAVCFRLLLPLFTVDMPCRRVEPGPLA